MVASEWGHIGERALYSSRSNWAGRGMCDRCFLGNRFLEGAQGRIPGVKDGGNSSPGGVESSYQEYRGWPPSILWEGMGESLKDAFSSGKR